MKLSLKSRTFEPFPLLQNPHLMTIVPACMPRHFPMLETTERKRVFQVAPGVKILAHCHWHAEPHRYPTLLLVHGLEGSSESSAIQGVTVKAFARRFNVVRMNMRNCGGTIKWSPSLYDSGMSGDVIAIIRELKKEGLPEIFTVGWSMGGNLVLKAAAELGSEGPALLSGICAISPALDLPSCIEILNDGLNRLYEHHFLNGLKTLMRKKASAFPGLFDIAVLDRVKSLREFDEEFTARFGGWGDATNYYEKASALPIIHQITVPTLIIQAKDDPLIPFASFESPALKTDYIELIATNYGGHCGFLQKDVEDEPDYDRFWAENRAVDFLRSQSSARLSY